MKVLVTGGTGFVGGAFLAREASEGRVSLRAAVRCDGQGLPPGVEPVLVAGLTSTADWRKAVTGCETVLHAAARVHVIQDSAANPLTEFRRVNVEGTVNLARQSADAGVRRLVFISSVKVNGEGSTFPYTVDSPVLPIDPYGISKWEAEQRLRQIEAETGMEVVVVRPTLVYGPGVKANFWNMMKVIQRGIPLPFAAITNKRSLIYIGNLVDALATCATHPAAAGQTYLVSDGKDISTPELLKKTANALGLQTRLFPFPLVLMRLAGKLTGTQAIVDRLAGSLSVDTTKIKRELGWTPPFTMEQGLAETASWFLKQRS